MNLRSYLFVPALLCAGYSVCASGPDELPLDPQIRIGHLDNGFTYYIRQNRMPENRVEMRLAVNAGSVLEDEDQRGLAHFCEHMAFNGSEHFEKNELISFLQSLGIQFGPELNAYTGFDETVYKLTLPADNISTLDSGLLVMRDWAAGLSFDGEEIDKERGVILEEWRMGRGADQRMWDKISPVLLKGSRYAERLPIGMREVIEGAPYDTLKRFYRDWYRPDQISLVVVGDMDPDDMEQRIRKQFSAIEMPAEVRKLDSYPVPGHEETLVAIASDKEASGTVLQIIHKFPARSRSSETGFERQVLEQCVAGMLNQRFAEKLENPEPPFANAGSGAGELTRSLDYWLLTAVVSDSGIDIGLRTLLEESKRVMVHGFVASEWERQKAEVLRGYEKAWLERDKTSSEQWAEAISEHYLTGKAVPAPELAFNMVRALVERVSLAEVNAMARELMEPKNRVVLVMGPDQILEAVNEEAVRNVVLAVDQAEVLPYEDKLAQSSLLEKEPVEGTVIDTEEIPELGAKRVALSNGVQVYLKKTDLKKDEILIRAMSRGGVSLHGLEDRINALYVAHVVGSSGYGSFSSTDLQKFFAGKSVQFSTEIEPYRESFSGACSPQDIEVFFQLLHLALQQPRYAEDAFQSFKSRMDAYLRDQAKDPMFHFYLKVNAVFGQNHPRSWPMMKVEDIPGIDYERTLDLYRQRFADADDFVLTVVGNYDEPLLLDMLKKYVASLPVVEGAEDWVDHGVRRPSDAQVHAVYKGVDDKSMSVMAYAKEAPYSHEGMLKLAALEQVLNIVLIEEVREKMSGVYAIQANARFRRAPVGQAELIVSFPSAPESVEPIEAKVVAILRDILDNGVSDLNVSKVKETMKRAFERQLQENRYWLEAINECAFWGEDFSHVVDPSELDAIDSAFIVDAIRLHFDPATFARVTLYPEAMDPNRAKAEVEPEAAASMPDPATAAVL
ncbi:MAG: insulinase family protein [Opitutales bacterium]|nr:insulinase family protein [Opitutales bacterium]